MVKNKRAKQGCIFDPLSDINTAKTFERCPCRILGDPGAVSRRRAKWRDESFQERS